MDNSLLTLVSAVPNLLIAVWVIINYQQTIRLLLENQARLIEQLMSLHPPQATDAKAIKKTGMDTGEK